MASLGASRSDSDFVALPSQQAVDQMKAAKPAGFRLSETIGSCLSAVPLYTADSEDAIVSGTRMIGSMGCIGTQERMISVRSAASVP